jgi:hypothetical protein
VSDILIYSVLEYDFCCEWSLPLSILSLVLTYLGIVVIMSGHYGHKSFASLTRSCGI